jgi:hypothetical protein
MITGRMIRMFGGIDAGVQIVMGWMEPWLFFCTAFCRASVLFCCVFAT